MTTALALLAALVKAVPTFEKWGDQLYAAWVDLRKQASIRNDENTTTNAVEAARNATWSCPFGVHCPLNPVCVSNAVTTGNGTPPATP